MEQNNLFKKRKAKAASKRQQKQNSLDIRYLIITEGEKSEPLYFQEMANDFKIASFIKISHNGSSPTSIIKYAQELYEKDSKQGDSFNKVFCVFDKDQHSDFDRALREFKKIKIKSENNEDVFQLIVSNPCFEFWFLLHFQYTSKSYEIIGSKSVGLQVTKDLKKCNQFENYEKAKKDTYFILKNKMNQAIKNSNRLRKENQKTNKDETYPNPSTDIDLLVNELNELRKNLYELGKPNELKLKTDENNSINKLKLRDF